MRRLYEKKDHLINRNRNLTSEQKAEIIELLGRHPSYENKIDWNKSNSLTYGDFLNVLRPLYINELDPRGLVEGQDYDIIYESNDEVLYFVYTYEASKILASNSVGPEMWTEIPNWCGEEEFTDEAHAFGYFDSEHRDMKPGAKWCISMQTSDRYWKKYRKDFFFFFWFENDENLGNDRKIAICVSKDNWEIAEVYDGADNEIEIELELPSYIIKAIENEKSIYEKKRIERIDIVKSKLKLNPQTNRYDYDGDLDRDILKTFFLSEDKDWFTISFGEITGDFDCSRLGIKSLKRTPQKVGGSFDCSSNQLTSLEGAPKKVGESFDCSNNELSSLEGAPKKVGLDFLCSYNDISSLEGAPQTVEGDFKCFWNKLTSLKGAPKEVGGDFYCFKNQLTSLEGAPKEVGRDFDCRKNQLTSLEGAPQEIGGDFNCSNNYLTSLEGAPQKGVRDFWCDNNQLTSLEGAPQKVDRRFYCTDNQLTSLEGAPQEIGGDFNCRRNPNLHSLDGIGEIRGDIYKDF